MLRTNSILAGLAAVITAAATFAACSASNGGGASGGFAGGGIGGSSGTAPGTGGVVFTATGTGAGMQHCDQSDPNKDGDGDGWTPAQGDCNDCDPNVNPGAVDVLVTPDGGMPVQVDANCNGMFDPPAPCDDGLALDDVSPVSGAKAIGVCRLASADGTRGKEGYSWGLLDAGYTLANGTPFTPGLDVGIMPNFGPNVNPQEGASLLVLSSGHARIKGQPGACNSDSCGPDVLHHAPPLFPANVPGCPGKPGTPIYDDVALDLKLRAPTNATGFKFNFKFHSFEFPEYVCTRFNDQFIALVAPPPMGSQNGNISFDSMNNPVSVNIAFFDVCNPATGGMWAQNCGPPAQCPPMPNPYCPSGPAQIVGTGFEGGWGNVGGATSWLETESPVTSGEEFEIRFTIWNTGDNALYSTVLVDGFSWIASGNVAVGTGKVPNPK
ncbi:MAG TPA: putative metal-binding motif-containing protein [Minicystis sp.]|nr:putative metal-binding motif-containing protein [Minicystis sp.]